MPAMTSAHNFRFTALDGAGEIDLASFAGKAVLIVNVASACGFTPQYRELQALYEARAGKGLVVLGVPCNDFGAQEPGSDAEIKAFCDSAYHVTFPMTSKVEIVAEAERHPFYKWVAEELGAAALPRWNFHKYLISKNGELLETLPSKTAPLAPQMLEAIDAALAA